MKLFLIPRLNYNFSFYDLGISLIGIFRSNFNTGKLCKFFNNHDIYFTNQARTGLRLLLNSFNLPPNARIGVQVLNCHTVFAAIIKAGFRPIFLDIDDSLTISLDDIKKKYNKIDALIVTHIFGFPAEIGKIKELMKDKPLIEDCAHSFLSRKNGKLTGTFGDAAVYSFGKAKFPSIGSGGFVVINNKSIIPKFAENFSRLEENNYFDEFKNVLKSVTQKILHIRYVYKFMTFPFIKRLNNYFNLNQDLAFLEKRVLKSNLSLLLKKIDKLELFIEKQSNHARSLEEYLEKYDNLKYVQFDDKSELNYFMLPVITSNKQKLINTFNKMGLEIGSHFNNSIEWAKELGYENEDCPNAETIIPSLVLFPTYKSIKFQ